MSRYAIGIDLGTTHCALSWVEMDKKDSTQAPSILHIPQQSAPGTVQDFALLPSFVYLPHPSEFTPGDLALPWEGAPDAVTGEWARRHGALTPIRLVSSAKSWLCHAGVDRRAGILPNDAPEEVARISPLEASTRYLVHLRDAWNHAHPDAPFGEQALTVTIPASFDPAARELTAEAAQAAGYHGVTLLEEPQAALYSWIAQSGGAWRKQVKVGDVILVVDVGGGTSDFSLIAVVEREGNLQLHRVAVGEHILLGGDNMDLALAHVVARQLVSDGKTLDAWQMRALTYACRVAKEALLSNAALHDQPLLIPSRGAKLIGGSINATLTRDALTATILEGFFPQINSSERPTVKRRSGLMQLGLPYAQDAAVTRHLAALLARQLGATAELEGFAQNAASHESAHESAPGVPTATFLHPTAVLFNGGVFKSEVLVQRTLATLNGWLAADGAPAARLLDGADLDFAVARGAAYYGTVRQGSGIRIRGGTAQAYYIGIESAMPAVPGLEPPIQALCVAPFGMEEGTEAALPPQEFGLVVGEAVRFRFFGSSVRRQDAVGLLLDAWAPDELQELAEIEATLPTEGRAVGEVVPVKLHARVSEAGTLELLAVPRSGGDGWKVEFEVRAESGE